MKLYVDLVREKSVADFSNTLYLHLTHSGIDSFLDCLIDVLDVKINTESQSFHESGDQSPEDSAYRVAYRKRIKELSIAKRALETLEQTLELSRQQKT